METKIFSSDLREAAQIIRSGGLVAVPTETVYGLAGNGLSEDSVREIYRVKGRPGDKPLALMVPGVEAMDQYCVNVPAAAKALAGRFWPGPLTIILNAAAGIPEAVLAGGTTVGLRCPNHEMTLELLRLAGTPLAAPSANPSGQPSPKDAAQVLKYFNGLIPAVVDGGPCGIGEESTLIDMSAAPYRILRQGALSREEIASALADELKIIGLTGPSGSGKTTALNELKRRGALIIDCDKVYHELLEGGELPGILAERFPAAEKGGRIDTKALGALVFSDSEALCELNGITHKYVSAEVERRLGEFAMSGGELAAIDAVELIGSGISKRCTAVIGVLADRETRIRRLMERDGISREYAQLRTGAQKPDDYFVNNCSHIIRNNGDIERFVYDFNRVIEEVISCGRIEEKSVL